MRGSDIVVTVTPSESPLVRNNDGLINSADDICALGLVTLGKSPGRISDTQITVFDSSGIAIQDLAVAGAIFEAAQQMSRVHYIDF